MSNRKNAHRRRLRVAVLAVVCGAVFAAFFARLAWMQFARADYYADKAAEASSASYTVTQHAARGIGRIHQISYMLNSYSLPVLQFSCGGS